MIVVSAINMVVRFPKVEVGDPGLQHGDEHQITADVDEISEEDRCPIDVDGSV